MKKENGLSMIALILIVVIISVAITIGVKHIKVYIAKEKDEDIKTNMLLIQGKITEIANKHVIDEAENGLIGIKLNLESEENEYNISDELKEILINLEGADLYILTKEDLENLSIKDIEVNKDEFYIVDYNSEEVYYSLGINGQYKLTALESKEEEKTEEPETSEEEQTEPEQVEQEETPETEQTETQGDNI